jgi:phosphopantothenoylcysteine synthetase/decarboxylase
VLLAPAMNTLMWQHPLTARHLRQLAVDVAGRT